MQRGVMTLLSQASIQGQTTPYILPQQIAGFNFNLRVRSKGNVVQPLSVNFQLAFSSKPCPSAEAENRVYRVYSARLKWGQRELDQFPFSVKSRLLLLDITVSEVDFIESHLWSLLVRVSDKIAPYTRHRVGQHYIDHRFLVFRPPNVE